MTSPLFARLLTLAVLTMPAIAQPPAKTAANRAASDEPLVDVSRACPGVVIDLRYATPRNITGKPIYPAGARAQLRRGVAEQLNRAQRFVADRGFALKVWDAYRPSSVQRLLWNAVRDPAYVVAPSNLGSLHGWGAAVDVTLVDFRGREVKMPTDFDSFSTAARYEYAGKDPEITFNLATLKSAMALAGFRHIRDEWWHYSSSGLQGYGPIEASLTGPDPALAIAKISAEDEIRSADPAKKKSRANRLIFSRRTGETL
jgi:D-alanyl-D-alanine dipeptidase